MRKRQKKQLQILQSSVPLALLSPVLPSVATPSIVPLTPPLTSSVDASPCAVRRSLGTSDKRKRSERMNVIAAKNEICSIFDTEKKQHKLLNADKD